MKVKRRSGLRLTVLRRCALALLAAAALTLGLVSPTAIADGESSPRPAAVRASAEEGRAAKKGNSFVRALGAPFRALGRLFGGGKKSGSSEAKRREPRAAPPPAAAEARPVDAASATPPRNDARPKVSDRAPRTEGVDVGVKAEEGARVVRPGETEAAAERPKVWVPVIEGISKDPLTQGRALLEHGYVQEAISELSIAATQVGPQLVEANNLLGLAYDRLGWHRQAAEAYGRALTISPKDPYLIANLGYSLYLADDYAGALKRLKQAARLAPGTPVIYNNIGIVQARLGKYDEAFKYFAIATNEYDAHLKLAGILEIERRDKEAVKHYEAALSMQPGASAILERLVALYERTGQRDKADTARRALGQPKNPQRTTTGGGGD
jgi:Flp pilus assembly protein TadD